MRSITCNANNIGDTSLILQYFMKVSMRQKKLLTRKSAVPASALALGTLLTFILGITLVYSSAISSHAQATPLYNPATSPDAQKPGQSPLPAPSSLNNPKIQVNKTPLGAGSEILIAHSTTLAADCTLTAIGHDSQQEIIGFTAGHCGEVGEPVLSPHNLNTPLGRVIKINPLLDYAVIRFDPSIVSPRRNIKNFPIDSYEAIPHSNPRIACKLGAASGLTCGETTITQSDIQTGQICILSGDSGAPVAVGTMLIGMVNAHHVFGCIGPESGTTISAILHDLGTHFTLE